MSHESLEFLLQSIKKELLLNQSKSLMLEKAQIFQASAKPKAIKPSVNIYNTNTIVTVTNKPAPKKEVQRELKKPIEKKRLDPRESHFKNLIQTINPNFNFTNSILSDKQTKLSDKLLKSTAPITFLKQAKSQKQKEIFVRIKRLCEDLTNKTQILDVDSLLDNESLQTLFSIQNIKLFIAPSAIFENSSLLKSHLKIYPGKILKKLSNTPLLIIEPTIDAEKSYETIKMCIERLKL